MDNSEQAKESSSAVTSKKKFKIGPFTIIEWLIVISIITILIILLNHAIQQTRNPKGPAGKMIPTELPNESNRIVHSTGLSIIAPVNWVYRDRNPAEPYIRIFPRVSRGRRDIANITVRLIGVPDTQYINTYIYTCNKTIFRGYPAFEKMEIRREKVFLDDPGNSLFTLYINHDGVWWFVEFSVADEMTELPKEIRQYINTIQFPKKSETTK